MHRLWVNREERAQLWIGTIFRKGACACKGSSLNVRLYDTKVELTRADRARVVNRTACGFDRTTDVVLFAAFVHQTADRAACRVINARDAARADSNKLLFRRGGSANADACKGNCGEKIVFQSHCFGLPD